MWQEASSLVSRWPELSLSLGPWIEDHEGRTLSQGENSTLLHQAPLTVMAFVFQSSWMRILPNIPEVEDSTDFFKSGAASVDVVR